MNFYIFFPCTYTYAVNGKNENCEEKREIACKLQW